MDAVTFVDNAQTKYDFIVHDVFSGGNVNPSLFTLDFIQKLKYLLKEDGVLTLVNTFVFNYLIIIHYAHFI